MSNFENPKDPNRYKGKEYKLSENSKLAGADFAYSGKLSSKIYKLMRILQLQPCETDTYSRFSRQLYEAVRNDQKHELGKLQLGFGSVAPLRNFRFSKKNSWQSFFRNYPIVNFEPEQGEVSVTLPPIYAKEFHLFPKRTSKVGVRMHFIQISIDVENRLEYCSSKELIITNDQDIESLSIRFSINGKSDLLLLCIASVRIWLVPVHGNDEFLSTNKAYMTAEIFDTLLIRDGQLYHFAEQKLPDISPPTSPDSNEELDWG